MEIIFKNKIKYLDFIINSIIPPRRITEIIIPITFPILPDCIINRFGSSCGNNYRIIIGYSSFINDGDRKRRGNIINFLKHKIKDTFISISPDNPIRDFGDTLVEKEEYISNDECKKVLSDFYDLIPDMNIKTGKQNLALTVIEKIKD